MTFIANLKRKFTAKSGGSGKECGPGMHRHPDAWEDKCHRQDQKHVRKQVGPNTTKNEQRKKTIKELEVH